MNDKPAYFFLNDLPQVIKDCISGNRAAQSLLYKCYAPLLLGICLRYARSREEAEDILQEGFIKVFESLHKFRHEGSFEGWMKKIMVNTALEKFRKKDFLHQAVALNDTDTNFAVDDNIIANLSAAELLNMIQLLPRVYRMVFNLYVFEGMKHREIAVLLGISEGTSKSNLSDARRILQKNIELMHPDEKIKK